MTATLTNTIRVLHDRATEDPLLAETVRFLVEDEAGPHDPFGEAGEPVRAAASLVNQRRLNERRESARARAIDTAQVVKILAPISDRKGVDRRRRRGQLLGWRVGRQILHPTWQFDLTRGDTWPGIGRVLEALGQVTADPFHADALMTTSREDLGGRTLADLLAGGRVETIVRLVLASGDQS